MALIALIALIILIYKKIELLNEYSNLFIE